MTLWTRVLTSVGLVACLSGCGAVLTRVDAGNTDYRIAPISRAGGYAGGLPQTELCAMSIADQSLRPPAFTDPGARILITPPPEGPPQPQIGRPSVDRWREESDVYELLGSLNSGGVLRTPQGRAVMELAALRPPYASRDELRWAGSIISPPSDSTPGDSTPGDEGGIVASTLRVSLKQAYVNNFSEGYFDKRGEVAVLATVREGGGGWVGSAPKTGRIVYFGEGVREQTFLNFRDQPVYGPITYRGGDVHARISLIEVDFGDNERNRQMLRTAAQLGQAVYPPASPVLAALEKLGGSLLEANGDDIDLDYVLRLSSTAWAAPADSAGSEYRVPREHIDAWLAEGYYIFVRTDTHERRLTEADWASLRLDPSTGVLYRMTGQFESIRLGEPGGLIDAGEPAVNDPTRPIDADDPAEHEPRYYRMPLVTEFTDASYLVLAVQAGFDATEQDLKQQVAQLDQLVESGLGGGGGAATEQIENSINSIRQMLSE
ncbi:MAG: hypothetical protein IT431_10760 [Phycisphaerales bacterium]|nr:hypothetical protein [Phycisphaerales bacterium]